MISRAPTSRAISAPASISQTLSSGLEIVSAIKTRGLISRAFERCDSWISVTSVDITWKLTAKDSVDLCHRLVGVGRARVNRCCSWLTGGRLISPAGVNQLCRDIEIVFIVKHHSVQKRSLKY